MTLIETSQPHNGGCPLSVVMPAYNEEAAIAEAVREVQELVLDKITGAELVVVNDGSRDRTGEILDGLADADPRVRGVHKVNGGHGPALITGMGAARGARILLVDSDLQIPLDGFGAFWEAVDGGKDGAFGIRAHRDDPRFRLILTRVIRSSLRMLFGTRLRDANVPFKLFDRGVWERARPLIPDDTLAPSLFLAVYASRNSLDIAHLPVSHKERQTGEVSIKRWSLIKFCWRAFRQLLRFRRALKAG